MSSRIYLIPTIFEDEGLMGEISKSYGFRVFDDTNNSYITFVGGKKEFLEFLNMNPEEALKYVRGCFSELGDCILDYLNEFGSGCIEINGESYDFNDKSKLIFEPGTKIGSDEFIKKVKGYKDE